MLSSAGEGRRPDVFVVPTYALAQIENAKRTAGLAARHGFRPVIVCNSATTAAALEGDPYALSAGGNTGYGGAANLVAANVQFDTMVLCNDDLEFTDVAMADVRAAVELARNRGGAAIIGVLPRDRPRLLALPGVLGVIALVSGLSGLQRRSGPMRSRVGAVYDLPSTASPRWLTGNVAFPFVCVAITREAWRMLGGFDHRFPLYFEDTDLLTRAHLTGEVAVGVVAGDLFHAHSATGRTVLPYIVPLMSLGARNYLQLHRRLPRVLSALLVSLGLLIRAVCWLPLRPNRRMEGRAILRALQAAWSSRGTPMPPW